MGSYNGNGRDRDPGRRGGRNRRAKRSPLHLESLEDRLLLNGDTPPAWRPTSQNVADVKNGPMANAGPDLIKVYQEYQAYKQSGRPLDNFKPSNTRITVRSGLIGVTVKGYGDINALATQLSGGNIGMFVTGKDAAFKMIEGFVSPDKLVTLARYEQVINNQRVLGVVGLRPMYNPVVWSQGAANNQAEDVFQLAQARQQYPTITGAGVTVGVLSDSANRVGNGLQDSINTGDLPPLNRINLIQDGPANSIPPPSDEGRAMMELIYDLAPGANLAFHTASGGETNFAAGIRALSAAGAQVIVDDVGYPFEPQYQAGPVDQAITDVVRNSNRVYFSSAANMGTNGFESPFRSSPTTTIAGMTGTFMDFDPGAGVMTLLPMTVTQGGLLVFQYDQPFFTSNGVVSDVDVFVVDANGNIVDNGTAIGNSDNIATQEPVETIQLAATGNLFLAVFVKSGPAPGRMFIRQFGGGDIQFSKQFGSSGGITYPTTGAHNAPIDGIGVGAIAFFDAPPFGTSLTTESFSSAGPRQIAFDPNGNRLTSVQILQRPQLTGVDGVNTTFFGSPDIAQDPDTFPNFFGTSAAAPNLAALAALMRQVTPGVTQADILSAMITSTIPLNGAAKGQWNPSSGFGLPQALRSFQEVDRLRVTTTTPANGATRTSLVTQITVNFNKNINASTVQASDLVFTQKPNGMTITPVSVQVTGPTTAVFTLQITRAFGAKANGAYAWTLGDGSISAADGKPLVAFTGTFTVADTISPRVVGTDITDRRIIIQFSEAMDPSLVTPQFFKLFRGISPQFNIHDLPGYKVNYFPTYNGMSNVAVIDLTDIPQSSLPSGRYILLIDDAVTDLAGNRLDGEFNGVFPSGDGKPLPAEDTDRDGFVQDFGVITLTAPNILSVSLDPLSDTGIPGDQNTRSVRPRFVGQVSSAFPGAIAGLTVVVQFRALHGNSFTLQQGQVVNGQLFQNRGFTVPSPGDIDFQTTTDPQGRFSFQAPANLPDGFHVVRVIVVGQPDQPPLPGLSRQVDQSFRVDTTTPTVAQTSIAQFARISDLTGGLTLDFRDPVLPSNLGNPLAVPLQFQVEALDPATASNISNYQLINVGSDLRAGGTGSAADVDYSNFITNATYNDTTNRTQTNSPFTGRVQLSFAPGLPAGRYVLVINSSANHATGVTDAAGNPLDASASMAGAQDFDLWFDFQPVPSFVTNIQMVSPVPGSPSQTVITGPRDFYEIPVSNSIPNSSGIAAPPNRIWVDFSSPLNLDLDYTNRVQLIRSADTAGGPADGDFGVDPFYASGRVTRVQNLTVTLVNSVLGATFGQPGFKNRLQIDLPAGTSLSADNYRLFLPNAVVGGQDLRIFDIFGNHIDGEFLGNPTATGGWETLLPTGATRAGISGDLVAGGSLVTAFTVVPQGNVIFVRPDYQDDPFLTSDDPDGSRQKPFTTLAPEALPTTQNGGNLNSAANFGTGFNPNLDLNGNGRFDRSAFYAASVRSANGPVVIVALPSLPGDPLNRTFVLQRPNQVPFDNSGRPLATIPDGSASVPFNTTLVFQPGTILKMRDSSLFVQNQGTAIQLRGGPNLNQQVRITSYLDDFIGGDTNRDGAPPPDGTGAAATPGDYGGIVLRNFDTTTGGRPIPVAPGPDDPSRPQVDGRLGLGLSGADDAMSYFNFGQIQYAGGAVPQSIGFRFDAITLFNSRPAITNMTINGRQPVGSVSGPNGGSQGGISGDMDSFREDTLARGPLIRNTTVKGTSLNGIYVRAELNGNIEPSNAIFYPSNPTTQGGVQNYTFDDPLPYIFVARMVLGRRLLHNASLDENLTYPTRLYVQPGMMIKFQHGAAIDLMTANASINIGDRTYINQFDLNNNIAPTTPGFVPQKVGDARVVLTSFFDDAAFTEYVDPTTGARTRIVATLDSDNGGTVNQPSAGNVPPPARWGSIAAIGTARVVIDEAEFRYGGGNVVVAGGAIPQRDVLNFTGTGARAYVTNNNFFDNQEAAIGIQPNGLLAADPLRPLQSGNPFFRGNVMQRNDVNGLEVIPPNQGSLPPGSWANLTVNSTWDDTDLTYVLRGTVRLAGRALPGAPSVFTDELTPAITLTIQSSLPDTPLADGNFIPKPGESVLVKLLNTRDTPIGDGVNGFPSGNIDSETRGGAGFLVGIDDGVDPDTDPLIDPGVMSQIRIVGIGGNETTNQPRIPAILTSLRDNSVGKTVRGVTMNQGASPAYLNAIGFGGAPAAGDGGVIGYGAHSLSDYNLFDPRDGNLIDNADIRFITRIEMQGGGWAYTLGPDPVDASIFDKLGANNPWNQFNTAKAMTISNSNLRDFSQAGVIAHPSGVSQIHFMQNPPQGQAPIGRGGWLGQPVYLFMYNNVIANMPVGVRINSETANNDVQPSPYVGIFMHNTFFGNGEGIHTEAPANNGQNDNSHVYFLAMDNIFANHTDTAVRVNGQAWGSQLLFNLFSGNASDTDTANAQALAGPFNALPIFGNPAFRNPSAGDFTPTATSDAIDAALSEVAQSNWGEALQPIATQVLSAVGGIRRTTGRILPFGGPPPDLSTPGDIVTLPGFPPDLRGFFDQWVPALPNSQDAVPGPAGNAATYWYRPITGERDQNGFLRVDEPGRPNVGFGSRPFFDVGAIEYRQLVGPRITDVTFVLPDPNTPGVTVERPLYVVGGTGGTNVAPQALRIKLDQRIDPATANSLTVLLQASGGDGIFGNANNSQDRFISLSGRLSYDPATSVITVGLGSLGLSLSNDLYRIIVRGSGGDVVRSTVGLALDGENTVGGLPDGAQLPLPSGDGVPGGDFFATFAVDTVAPQVVAGSLALATDSNRPNDRITNTNTPTFTGRIFDVPPPTNPLLGQTIILDVDTNGDGVFDRLDVGRATTDASGFFSVTSSVALPNTPYSVGPDGLLGTADDRNYSVARIRVIDQSGNQSFAGSTAARLSFVVDTSGPRVTGASPLPGAQVNPVGGTIAVALSISENLDPDSVNESTIRATRSGGDGIFGNGNDVALALVPGSISLTPLFTGGGAMILRFSVAGANVNDIYRITLVGTGAGVIDIAGNLLDGETPNGLPSGNGTPGGDFNLDVTVLNPALSRTIFVSAGALGTPTGSRSAPFPTITAGLAAANIGDTVAVIGGTSTSQAVTYREAITLKSLVRVISVDPSSTDGNLVPGLALKTVIAAPLPASGQSVATVTATNLTSLPSFATELRGFSIASPLSNNSPNGPILSGSTGVFINNSDILVDRNYILDSRQGVAIFINNLARSPRLESNVIVGNIFGVVLDDQAGSTTGFANGRAVGLVNNTIAWNNTGLNVVTDTSGPQIADVVNNIFWQNAQRTVLREGVAIQATSPNRVQVRGNLFSSNGPSVTSPADDTVGVGGGFNPALLSSSQPDALGNFTGNPSFVQPLDPRPEGNGPGNFFLGANYDITSGSAAIDNAINSAAPATDFRFRGRVDIANRGFAGTGPADVGAFEFNGTAGVGTGTTGGSTFSAPPVNTLGRSFSVGASLYSISQQSVVLRFNSAVSALTVNATDLLLSGSGIDPSNPARAVSVRWIDARTAKFSLTGRFLKTGTVQVDIAPGAIRNTNGTLLPNFSKLVPTPGASSKAMIFAVPSASAAVAMSARKPAKRA
jgi:hypothetical protein